MPRWALCLGLVVSLFVGFAILTYRTIPELVSEQKLRSALSDYVRDWTGGEGRLRHFSGLSVDQRLRVVVEDAVIAGTAEGMEWRIEVAAFSAALRFLPLIGGRIEVGRLEFDRPRIELRDSDIPGPEIPVTTAVARSRPVGEVILKDASIAQEGVGELHGLDLRLAALGDSAAVLLTGAVPTGGGRVAIEAWVEDPAAALSSGGSRARLAFRAAGAAQEGGLPSAPLRNVAVAADDGEFARALRRIVTTLGLPFSGETVIRGRFALSPRSLEIADATMSAGRIVVEGDLAVALAGEGPAADRLMGVLRGADRTWSDGAEALASGAWPEVPISLDWLAPIAVDLAADVQVGGLAGPELAARNVRLEARDGEVRLDINAVGDLGRLRVEATAEVGPNGGDDSIRIASKGRLEEVDLGALGDILVSQGAPPLVSPMQLPQGTLEGQFDIAARGDTLGDLLAGLDGSLEARATEGSLTGADLILTLESVAEGRRFMTEQDGPLIPAAGRTKFDTVEGRIDFVQGIARLARARIKGGRYTIDLSGEATLPVGEMWAEGQASLRPADANAAAPAVDLPFGFGGTVTAPVVAAGVPRRDGEAAIEPVTDRGDR